MRKFRLLRKKEKGPLVKRYGGPICSRTYTKKRDRSLSWGKHDRCTQIKGCVGEVLGPEYLLP